MEREDIYSRKNQTREGQVSRHRRYEDEAYVPHYSDGRKVKPEIEVKRVNRTNSGSTTANRPRPSAAHTPEQRAAATGKAPVNRKAPNKKKKHMVGRILAIIQAILSVIVLGLLFALDVLPMKFIVLAAVLLLILWVFAFFSQFTKKAHVIGKIESLVLCVVLILGTYYLSATRTFLGDVTGSTIKVDNMVIAVMKDDPAQSLADAAEYTFGVQMVLDGENTEKILQDITKNIGHDVNVQSFSGISQQVDALYDGTVGAIVYNEAFMEVIAEQHPTFNEDVRVLENVKIETKVEVTTSEVEVTNDTFTLYITGNDAYGHIASNGRSDVNMLVTVNPDTKQILLTTTPRDYYVEFPGVTGGAKDKLTHAGIYGVDCSMNTLGELYGIKIDHYVKVNFTSVVKIVEQLGGVEVYSEYEFKSIYGYHYDQGWNTITNGEEALAFVRERKNLPGGDLQRGKNQQAMITAMIKKAMSPAILANYTGLLASMDGNFETSMRMNDITELIKMQLDEGGEWNIVSQSADGVAVDGKECYSSPGDALSVVEPDVESVEAAKAQIQSVYDGQILGAAVTE